MQPNLSTESLNFRFTEFILCSSIQSPTVFVLQFEQTMGWRLQAKRAGRAVHNSQSVMLGGLVKASQAP